MRTKLMLLAAIVLTAAPSYAEPGSGVGEIRKDLVDVGLAKYDLKKDVVELVSDRAEIWQSRKTLRGDFLGYRDAVREHGRDSEQAREALSRVERSQMSLHEDLRDFRRDLWDASRDRRRLALERLELIKDLRDVRRVHHERRDARQAARELRQDRRELRRDIRRGVSRRELRHDLREIRQDRRQLRREFIQMKIAERAAARR